VSTNRQFEIYWQKEIIEWAGLSDLVVKDDVFSLFHVLTSPEAIDRIKKKIEEDDGKITIDHELYERRGVITNYYMLYCNQDGDQIYAGEGFTKPESFIQAAIESMRGKIYNQMWPT